MYCQFMEVPTQPHWDATIRIVKYLMIALGKWILCANHGNVNIEAFSYANQIGLPSVRTPTTRLCVFQEVIWSYGRVKNNVTTLSSLEFEYRAMTHVACKVTRIHNILGEISVMVNVPVTL